MEGKMWVLFLLSILFINGDETLAADPDPFLDFCVLAKDGKNPTDCKEPKDVTPDDFIFKGFKNPGIFNDIGYASVPTTPQNFPGSNTFGMTFVRVDMKPGGINPPHFHPRATEGFVVVQGKVYAGFVDTNNKIYAKVVEQGEMTVLPRGLVHFFMNVGDTNCQLFAVLNSQNPGTQKINHAVFGSGVKEELLEKAFGFDKNSIAVLQQKYEIKIPK